MTRAGDTGKVDKSLPFHPRVELEMFPMPLCFFGETEVNMKWNSVPCRGRLSWMFLLKICLIHYLIRKWMAYCVFSKVSGENSLKEHQVVCVSVCVCALVCACVCVHVPVCACFLCLLLITFAPWPDRWIPKECTRQSWNCSLVTYRTRKKHCITKGIHYFSWYT